MPDPKPARPRRLRLVLAIVAVGLALFAAVSWLNRKSLAREALTGWLKSKGVAAQADVEAFGPTTFRARLVLGDPAHPDFAAEHADVRYRMTLSGLQVEQVVLHAPALRASARGGKLSAGSLDPLIREFLARPPKPNAAKPRIRIERGQLLLATDYGPVRVTADALVDDGKLQRLTATSAPMTLRGAGFEADLGAGRLTEVTAAGKVAADLEVPISRLMAQGARLGDGRLSLKFGSAYPDPAKTRGLGAFTLAANVTARSADAGGRSVREPSLAVAVVGEARGWVRDLAVAGRATADLSAAGGSADGMGAGRLRAALAADDLRWTRGRSDQVSAALVATATADEVSAGGLRMDTLTVAAKGPLKLTSSMGELELAGSAVGHGRWDGFGPVGPLDQGQVITIKRAARGFRVAAPAWGMSWSRRPSDVGGAPQTAFAMWPQKPVVLRPDTGGEVRIDGHAREFRLTSSGGGLPVVDLTLRAPSFRDGFAADVSGKARVSASYAVDADIEAAGRLTIVNGRTAFAAQRCAGVRIARLEFGVNDVEQVAARLCPAGEPLFTMARGDWRLTGRAEDASASVPFLQMRVSAGAGRLTAASRGGHITAQADIAAARLADTAAAPRFYAMTGSGRAGLAGYEWTADIAMRPPRGPKVLDAHLVHDGGLGVGFVTLETGDLTFAEGGLQPAELSPMARAIGGPATGRARFSGRFDWARIGAGSSGSLTLKDMGFESPAGRVEGLNGTIAFTSLAPLVAAPGQALDVASIAAIVPLTNLNARFALSDNVLKIEGGEAEVGGGRIRVESLETPLLPGAPTRGVLIFEGVQLHDLVEASPFGDKVDLDAKVSGRVSFEAVDNKVRISTGELKAIQPGRISIDRAALTGVTADTAVAAPAAAPIDDPNATFTDFAYQAMENLAFETLEATVASRPDGRLGVLFHIVGKHDPPTKQKIKLTVMDLIQKRFLGRKLPLPSGTGVNLTLDTTLNLDDLLADYAEYRKLHGSGEVQP